MQTHSEPYDLIVVGGGITGAGIARDAALRGLRVALFEKGDYGSGTSSKSSKMIHGGLRYLEHGEIGLVFESVSERAVQSRVAPHLVKPMPFLVPIYQGHKPGLEIINLGLWIYDTLALFRAPQLHKTFRGERARKVEPALKQDGLSGALEYYDCVTDDARLVLENIIDARTRGARCESYTPVVKLLRAPDGRVSGVVVRDRLTGEEETVHGRCVILAAGAWTDEANAALKVGLDKKLLRRTKGVHLVFPREKLPLERAVTLISPVDGRVMFAIPWRDRTVIGTTDTYFEGTADDVEADADDVQYLCDSANGYFPSANFRPEDVIATWAGLRPLINDEDAEDEGAVSREHEIFVREDGIIIIAGGKLTTYRRMAKEVVRKAVKWLRAETDALEDRKVTRPRSKKRPLPGAEGLSEGSQEGVRALGAELVAKHGLSEGTAAHLAAIYGTRARIIAASIAEDPSGGEPLEAGLPHVWAEIDFACTHDLARTLDDVLERRVPLLLIGRDQGLDVCERVADRMATQLGWTRDVRDANVAAYRKNVAGSRRYRTERTEARAAEAGAG